MPHTRRRQATARERYLSVAEDLAANPASADQAPIATGNIRMADVAEELGKARTTIYKLWETQHLFSIDLGLYLALQHDYSRSADQLYWNELILASPESDAALEQLRVAANDMQHVVFNDVLILIRAASLGLPTGSPVDDRINKVRRPIEMQRLNDLASFLSGSLRALGRQVDTVIQPSDLAVATWCLSDGIATLAHSLRTVRSEVLMISEAGEPSRPWGLWSYALRSMVTTYAIPHHVLASEETVPRPRPDSLDPYRFVGEEMWSSRQLEALEAGGRLRVAQLCSPWDETPSDTATALGHLTVARVARACGVSRRAVYDIWPKRSDLLLDVLRSVLRRHHANHLRHFDQAVSKSHPTGAVRSIPAIVDDVANTLGQSSADDRVLLSFLTETDPTIRAFIEVETKRLIDALATRIEQLVIAEGHQLNEWVTPDHLAMITLGALDGIRRLRRTCPGALRLGTAQRNLGHTAPAIAVGAVFHHSLRLPPLV